MFGKYLYELRMSKNITQRELAEKVGVDFTYISKVENGIVDPPSERTTMKMAEALGADVDEILVKAGRIPSDVQQYILENVEVLHFLRMAKDKKLSGGKWKALKNFFDSI